jgi:hypothetical protein
MRRRAPLLAPLLAPLFDVSVRSDASERGEEREHARMLTCGVLIAAIALAVVSTSPPADNKAPDAPSEKPRVLVMDLDGSGVDPSQVKLINGLVTQSMSRFEQYEVISSADVRQLVTVEADKSAAGCDTSTCLAEMAGALGARWVVFGNVGRLGNLTVLTLSLFDTQKAKAADRQRLEVRDIETLPSSIDNALAVLMGVQKPAAPAPTPSKGLPILFYGSAAAAGVGLVGAVVTGIWASSLDGNLANAASSPKDKQDALDTGPWVLGGAAALSVVALAGAGVAAYSLVME